MSRRPAHRRRSALGLAAAATAALAMATQSLHGQTAPAADSDTIYFGQRQQTEEPVLSLAPVHGSVDLIGTYTKSQTSSGAVDSNSHEWLFQESLTLYTTGYVVHPNLVDMRFSITGGLQQDQFSDDNGSVNSNGTIWGWNAGVTFMRNEPTSLTLYSRRTESTLDVPFGPTEKLTTTVTGGIASYRTEGYVSQIEAYHEVDEQSNLGPNSPGYTQTQDVATGFGNARLSPTQTLNWNASLMNSRYDSGNFSSDLQSLNAALYHTAAFGEADRCSLLSSASYTSQTGAIEQDDFHWVEHLHIWHTPNFETNYDYAYETQSFGGTHTDRQFASVDARHQLYNSLTTTGRFSWQDVTSGDTSVDTYLANLNLNYQKNVPGGILFADMLLAREEQDTSGSGAIAITDRPAIFIGVDPITILQPNAIPSSVVLRDATSGRIFQEGVDYTVDSTPLGLQINRVLGGNIPAGSPLLLNYEFDPQNASEIVTNIFGLGSRYQITKGPLAGLTPFARFLAENQTVSGGTAQPNDVRDYIVGATYTRGEFLLLGQREWFDSTLYPFESWRGEARWMHNLTAATNLSLSTIYTDTQYHQPNDHTQGTSFNASLSHRFSTYLYANVYAAYALVDSSTGGRTVGWEEGGEVDWSYRETKVYMRVRNSTLNSDSTDQQFQYFEVGISRSF